MQGFFTPEELEDRIQVEFDFEEGPNCTQCGLYRNCQSPKMSPTGDGRKGVLIIAEAPGKNEDIQGIQLVGEAGQLLRSELRKLDLNLDTDFWKTNAVCCRPSESSGANRKPTKIEMRNCRPLLEKTIQDLKPKMIWLLGGVAVESVYQGRFSDLSIGRWRKLCIPDRKTGAWIIPMFHPSYINRNSRDENLRAVWERDLAWAVEQIDREPFTFHDERDEVHCIYDFNEVIQTLKTVLATAGKQRVQLYVDYETNALKPQWPGAKIATVSFCVDYDETAIAFPYQYSDYFTQQQRLQIKALWRKICVHKNIYFTAHNMKFEDAWTRKLFGVQPRNWDWDTMIAAHIQDNRSKFSGLKFQSYINFGLEPYNKEINKYLKAASNTHFNSVDKAPLPDLLLYNGLDTKMGLKLWREQRAWFSAGPQGLLDAYTLFHDGILALSDIQMNGICIDEEYYKEKEQELSEKIANIKQSLLNSEEAKAFMTQMGKPLDLGSPKELGILFYKVLQLPSQTTDKGNYRVDVDALDSIKIPFVKDLIQMRKWEKARGTYFAQLLRESCKSKIYPFYDLVVPVTYRSSSQAPNFQNLPIRDSEIGPMIRDGIIPSKGNRIMEADYSSIEVRIAAIYTNDPILIAQATTDGADMHTDSAMDTWMLTREEVSKSIRQDIKGNVNFALFYGSFYKQCAEKLWRQLDLETKSGVSLRDHITTKGIRNYADFLEHFRQFEEDFWNKRFYVYKQWKEDINLFYRKHGYVENKLGFRFVSAMNEREVTNYPVQSTAFHCLLNSLILLNNIAKKEKWRSKIIGQIHDSAIIDLDPAEQDHVFKTCSYIMSEKVRELYPWITVPIPIEIECSGIDEPWSCKKEIKIN